MGKNDFDIDFDFEEEYGFDPKAFLGDEAYDDTVDLNAFSDEELGLTSPDASEEAEEAPAVGETEDTFDLDEDLDSEDFLNMGSQEEEMQEEDPEEEAAWEEEPDDPGAEESEYEEEDEIFGEDEEESEDEYEEDEDLPEDEEPEEIAMDENMEYTEEELLDEEVYEEESQDETFQFDEEDDQEEPKRMPRQKKERKPIVLPKITLPKLKTPNIFTKFYDLYFAPVLDKNWQNPEDPKPDPNSPRRRRRKTKAQIFKEVYLPPIIACVCMILVMSFLMGSLSNVIEERRLQKQAEASRQSESISAAQQAQQASLEIAAEAEKRAAGYDYQSAIDLLDTIGDLSQFPELASKRAEYGTKQSQLVSYSDPSTIPNLSFHVLINDMARAKADPTYGGSYNRNFVTTSEFSKILDQLYNNGYVLVDFDSFVDYSTDLNGQQKYESVPLYLPADKKPVMITETMVNYYAYMIDPDKDGVPDAKGGGFASKLVLDGNGDIKAEYVDANGQTLVGNYDLVPILEDFIKAHPDFSYRGARATLAVTGDEGVFGYRINTSVVSTKGNDYYNQEVAGAQQIVQALKNKGYTIACYSFKNVDYRNANATTIKADLTSWKDQIASVIGSVDTFVFAKMSNLTQYSGGSFDTMYDAGFRFFVSNGDQPMTEVNDTYVRQNRLMVTGETMQHNSSRFTGLFDCNMVLEASIRGNIATG